MLLRGRGRGEGEKTNVKVYPISSTLRGERRKRRRRGNSKLYQFFATSPGRKWVAREIEEGREKREKPFPLHAPFGGERREMG